MSFDLEIEDGRKQPYDVLSKQQEEEEEEENKVNNNSKERTASGLVDEKILRMMVKMGYKTGGGLGKNGQGITKPVNMQVQFDRKGLDLCLRNFKDAAAVRWDSSLERINVKEELIWLENENEDEDLNVLECELRSWMLKGKPPSGVDTETTEFIDAELLRDIIKAKDVFEELGVAELSKARTRANPFETLRHAFFMNRAALKMANIDAITDFMFTNLDRDLNHRKSDGPYYFADVCAGPGGFSEYVLWRKKWLYKGFGLTLKGEHDFKLHDSSCMSAVTFQPYYGVGGDGDVYNPANVRDFAEKVLGQTDGLGVHFMTADGGFSVEGQENLQEVLSRHLYLSQCLLALEIVRENGHFVTKLFDIFTRFSVGLIFLMHRCFEKIAIVKPNSSRPANSERYLICKGLKKAERTSQIRKYLREVALELWNIKQAKLDVDVVEIVPLDVLRGRTQFFNYIKRSNVCLGERQRIGLLKLAAFAKNVSLEEPRQEMLRTQCLAHWRIPDKPRLSLPKLTVDELLCCASSKPEFMLAQARDVSSIESLAQVVSNCREWHCLTSGSAESSFFVGLGSSKLAYKLQKNRWIKVKNVKLCRGTILYGELVQERCVLNPGGEECEVKSLHVIDALRLGDTSLADLPFHERHSCVQTYCKAANFEGVFPSVVRLRPKTILPLESLSTEPSAIYYSSDAECCCTDLLPVLGFNTSREFHTVHSVILLKTDENQSFSSTYVLRIQVNLSEKFSNNPVSAVSLDDLNNFVRGGNGNLL